MNNKTWTLRSVTPEEEERKRVLAETLDLPPLIVGLLAQRGLTLESDIRQFLHGTLSDLPDPFLLNEMDRAVDRLLKACERKEKILFFGDYDVDGITGCAQIQNYFREAGFSSEVFLPHRMKEGYGLTEESVRGILALKPDLLVTIDNGTTAREAISFLKEKGIETIVVDHHETPSEKARPPAVALLNPKAPHAGFKEKNIASAGLIFLLLMAFRSRCRERGLSPLPNLKRYLDLACLGTIADIVPLTGTNRLLVKYGLEEMGGMKRPGLKALMEVSAVQPPVNAGMVSFRLAPRINAAGRLSDPRWALDLLLAKDTAEAAPLAAKLEEFNRERQRLEETAVREAIEMVERDQGDRKGIVVASSRWHLGIVGIMAAKLTERFYRPAVVLSLSEDGKDARGSARTIPGLSVYAALKKIEKDMTRFGGHDAAAGMSLPAEDVQRFAENFDRSVREAWVDSLTPRLFIDAEIPLQHVNAPLIKELTALEPYGPANPEPVFRASSVSLAASRIVGSNHFKTTLCQGGSRVDAIGFGWGSYLETVMKQDLHDVAFYPQFNQWNGVERIQLKIKSIVPST